MSRLLVIGGSGFIGSHVCRIARTRGYAVTALSLREPASRVEGVRYRAANLADRELVGAELAGQPFEYIVNCGGYVDHRAYFAGGRDVIETHFEGLQNLVDSVDRNCLRRFVQIGSSDEYGDAPAPQAENVREAPISPYSLAKVAATHFLEMLWRTDRFPAVTLRLFLTYGPGQGSQRFLPQIIDGCLKDQRFPVSEGRQQRDFCYVDDVVDGILGALEAPAVCGRVVNLASGVPITVRAAVERIRDLVGKGEPDFGRVPYRTGENMALWADVELARELLRWNPQVSLGEGLARTIEYYKDQVSAL
jgi:UDP-glucose 4-epimerase